MAHGALTVEELGTIRSAREAGGGAIDRGREAGATHGAQYRDGPWYKLEPRKRGAPLGNPGGGRRRRVESGEAEAMASVAESESSDEEGGADSEGVDADGGEGLPDVEENEVQVGVHGVGVGLGFSVLPSAITQQSFEEMVVRIPRPERDAVINFSASVHGLCGRCDWGSGCLD